MKFVQKYGRQCLKHLNEKQDGTGIHRNRSFSLHADWLKGIYFIDRMIKNLTTSSKTQEFYEKIHVQSAKDTETHTLINSMSGGDLMHQRKNQLQFTLTKLMRTNPEDPASVQMANTSTKSILQTEHTTLRVFAIWFISRYLFRQRREFRKRRWQWMRNPK